MKGPSQKHLLEEIEPRDARIEKMGAMIDALQAENALLRQKLDLLIRKVFGASSEKLDPAQLDLFLLQAEDAPGKAQASFVEKEADPQRSRHRKKGICRTTCPSLKK